MLGRPNVLQDDLNAVLVIICSIHIDLPSKMSNLYAVLNPNSFLNLIVRATAPDNLFLGELSIEVGGFDSSLIQDASMECSNTEYTKTAVNTVPSDLLFETLHFTLSFKNFGDCIWEWEPKTEQLLPYEFNILAGSCLLVILIRACPGVDHAIRSHRI